MQGASLGLKPFETLSNIGLQVDWQPESEYCDQWPLVMSTFQAMKGHQQFFFLQ